MKKFKYFVATLVIMVFFAAFFIAATTTQVDVGESSISVPTNLWGANLHTRSTALAKDTFSDTSAMKVYGPFSICRKGGGPMASYLNIKADAITGTTPQMQIYFQLISGTSITDTIASWTSLCQINASAKDTVYDISGLVGKSVVFLIDNSDSTACQIPGLLQFQMKDATTEYIKIK